MLAPNGRNITKLYLLLINVRTSKKNLLTSNNINDGLVNNSQAILARFFSPPLNPLLI